MSDTVKPSTRIDTIREDLLESKDVLQKFIEEDSNLALIAHAAQFCVDAINSGNKIISCGNGGSMSDAMHFAEELTGRFRDDRKSMPAIAISDPSYITCTANDYGYEEVFSRFITGMGNKGDVLLAISTSGNSENVIRAVAAAKLGGLKVIGLSGKNGGLLSTIADVSIVIPHHGYADRIQEVHIKVIHAMIRYIEQQAAACKD